MCLDVNPFDSYEARPSRSDYGKEENGPFVAVERRYQITEDDGEAERGT